ncbi:MAG: hypothetical protein ABH800_01870 [Candidatus Nealsonbacteria bacterium]
MEVKNRVKKVLEKIRENGYVKTLRQCQDLKERFDKLTELFPETYRWDPITARQLVYILQKKHDLDFGVCPFYQMKGKKQYCIIDGKPIECTCIIPQPHCVFRDRKSKDLN